MRKRCNRKIWSTNINPVSHAIAGAAITDATTLNKLRVKELSAIDAITKGKGILEDWKTVADFLNISETMGNNGIGPEILPYCEQLTKAMLEAAKRYETTRKIVLSGEGIRALKEVYEYHDLQRTSIARSVYEQMIEKTWTAIQNKHATVVELT